MWRSLSGSNSESENILRFNMEMDSGFSLNGGIPLYLLGLCQSFSVPLFLLEQLELILEEVRSIFENQEVILEQTVTILAQLKNILENRNYIRKNKILLELLRIY